MWKHAHASVVGTSHLRHGLSCQDASRAEVIAHKGEDTLLLVCSDGAGSAPLSEEGSRLACELFIRGAAERVALGFSPAAMTSDEATRLCLDIQDGIATRAHALNVTTRELACTLVAAIVSPLGAAFIQVGDGAIVLRDNGSALRLPFWPDSGEYINTTFFVTDRAIADKIQFAVWPSQVREIALLTDGLQMLCLRYQDRSVHQPFFEPLFRSLRAAATGLALHEPLRAFLDSPPVNSRTDDDKTLVLAGRPYLALAPA